MSVLRWRQLAVMVFAALVLGGLGVAFASSAEKTNDAEVCFVAAAGLEVIVVTGAVASIVQV